MATDSRDGLVRQLTLAGSKRGLQAELTEHVGHENGDVEAELLPNSRNGAFPKKFAA
ncbi:MAG: hypothetical protein ACOH1J_02565 [Microbacteriaceae bacterium]